ncbi:MAG: hypothetical protein R3B90_22560 [Planctomycetaceae bacterium]
MLNTDLQPRHLSIPEPVELPEVEVVIDTYVKGYFVGCPNCEAELRIAGKYLGQTVQCKFCTAPFKFALKEPSIKWIAVYSECANCQQEIRAP